MPDPRSEILKGTLDMLILTALAHEARHGYGIAQWLEQTSGNLLVIEQGSLYPALYRMEEKGWISARWGLTDLNRRAKFYTLTTDGRDRLRAEARGWARMTRAVELVLDHLRA